MDDFLNRDTLTLEEFNQPEDFLKIPKTVQRIDLKKLKLKDGRANYSLANGAIVTIYNFNTNYMADFRFPKSPFSYLSYYDLEGALFKKTVKLYNLSLGTTLEFDKNSKLIRETKYRGGFPSFSINQLRDMMLQKKGIDIFVKGNENSPLANEILDLSVFVMPNANGMQVYVIYVFTKDSERSVDAYIINGKTGEQIYFKHYAILPSFEEAGVIPDYLQETQPEYFEKLKRRAEDPWGLYLEPTQPATITPLETINKAKK